MKVGDFVDIPTGRGVDRCQGLLIDIRNNPSDVQNNFHNGGKIRKIVDVLSKGIVLTVWYHHARMINESR